MHVQNRGCIARKSSFVRSENEPCLSLLALRVQIAQVMDKLRRGVTAADVQRLTTT